ncbi:hypothetical protein I3F58_25025 [Streptomyces sp. MUM 203J]|uniref:DUF6332 family protein n=1 Tax=Streptomyces sp. MUM 203J TaxID=2791990 RepID=UPI001F034C9C|nr:DUF6332 family protein [Streptomyces sp. MUM 203J]MCH0542764.1 hypothetical protein [Streptomyces sp. MUM 203J]
MRRDGDRQARRDAVTVEIGFALATGALLAGVLFCLVAAPVPLFGLEDGTARGWLRAAGAVAAAGFVGRVARVLWGFGRPRP